MMTPDLFVDTSADESMLLRIGPGAVYLREFLQPDTTAIINAIAVVTDAAPFRHLTTPGGKTMSVAMSNCGTMGWVSDHAGYRYQAWDPMTKQAWPAMPALWLALAQRAATTAGYDDFQPDVCLINRYQPGARMGLHQDKDERNLTAPIVSFSLGLPATFIWGGLQRVGKTRRFEVRHGDVVVWGGEDRLRFHGVAPLKAGHHESTGAFRFNITFRQTGG